MLIDAGLEPTVLVQENFKSDREFWQPHNLDIRPVLPDLPDATVEILKQVLVSQLADMDVCITHDLVLLPTHSVYDKAIRELNLDILWLHYIHSAPNPTHTMPPGYIVYPNYYNQPRVIKAYQTQEQISRIIVNRASHALDPLLMWNYSPLTLDLIEKFNLLDAEFSCVFPARLDAGKQPEKIIRLLAGIKKMGYSTKLLIVDWQSQGKRFQKYIKQLQEVISELDITDDVAFTSKLDDRASQGVPKYVVTELMDLTTVYVHPSMIETYSLVVHEAILRGKLVCLNGDLQVMRELFGDAGIYFDFGSDEVVRTYSPDEQAFWNDEAGRLVQEFYSNRALVAQARARQRWTPKAMAKDFLRLLYLEKC